MEKQYTSSLNLVKNMINTEAMSDIDYVEMYQIPGLLPVDKTITTKVLLAVAVKFGTNSFNRSCFGGQIKMLYNMFHGKIHRATVTEANLEYMGSITIDEELLELAGILPGERVQVVNNNNGSRLETYTIAGKRGSGVICLNGAAAGKTASWRYCNYYRLCYDGQTRSYCFNS